MIPKDQPRTFISADKLKKIEAARREAERLQKEAAEQEESYKAIAQQWNEHTEAYERLSGRIETLKTFYDRTVAAVATSLETLTERGGSTFEALNPVAMAGEIASTQAGLPVLSGVIETLEKRIASDGARIIAFAKEHNVPREAWPEKLFRVGEGRRVPAVQAPPARSASAGKSPAQ